MRILKKLLDRLVHGKPDVWQSDAREAQRLEPGETPVPGKIYRGPMPMLVWDGLNPHSGFDGSGMPTSHVPVTPPPVQARLVLGFKSEDEMRFTYEALMLSMDRLEAGRKRQLVMMVASRLRRTS